MNKPNAATPSETTFRALLEQILMAPTLQRGSPSLAAPAAFPRWSVGTIKLTAGEKRALKNPDTLDGE